jgi:hypothetical protein
VSEDLTLKIEGIEAELKKALEAQEAERKANGEVSEKVGNEISKLTVDLLALQKEAQEKAAEAEATIAEMTGRLDEFETAMKRGEGFPFQEEEMLLPGTKFVRSDQYKAMIAANNQSCGPVDVKTLFPERKTNLLSTAATRLVVPERLPDIMLQSFRQLRIRDLIPVRTTASNAVEYVREVGFSPGTGSAVTTLAVSSGTATATQTAHGYIVGQRVRIAGVTDETDLNGDHYILTVADANTYTFDTTAGDTAGAAGTITALLLQQHGAAAEVAEAGDKPEGQLDLELRTEAVQTIAHFLPASRQILMDEAQLEAYVNDRLRYGVLYHEEVQLLYGTGSSPQIQGIMTEVGLQNWAWSDGLLSPLDTKIDAIRRGMTRAHLLEYVPSGVVVHPSDWEDIQLAKGTDETYIWLSVPSGTGQQFFLLPVVVTNAINAAEALVGSFQLGSTIWDREQVTVRVSESHSDYFTKNLVALLAEERICQTIYRPDSFVKVAFDAAPS